MSRTIHVLPDVVANQIAAGEVVERPASVVKELVENALDAGATRVEVHLGSGGKREIRVSDDGSGMGREDALLALDRHATSKIGAADDLRGIRSFGFRGEALPSIASVSRLSLETCLRGATAGTRLLARGGTVTVVEDHARTPGTTVVVERLFFNAPARARFLRPPATETRAVNDALIPLALANEKVSILLTSDGRTLLDLPATSDVVGRIAAIWGEDAAGELLVLEHEAEGFTLRGVVQRPDRVRPGFRRAHLFVDGRPFRDPAVLRAADRGYRTTIPPDHRPWVFLFLDVPRGSVDVNVHPTKAEVRFHDRGAVERAVEEAVRTALEGEASAATLDETPARPFLPVRERSPGRFGDGAPGPPDRSGGPRGVQARAVAMEADEQMTFLVSSPVTGAGADAARADTDRGEAARADAASVDTADGTLTHPVEVEGFQRPRLWQVHQSWILAEVRDGLLLIDQHAAHERILFERLMTRFDGSVEESQHLLFPLTIRLTPAEVRMVDDLKGLLHRAGFEVEAFGEGTVILQAVPNPHPYFDAEKVFREMIDELTHGSELVRSARNQHERLAMSFACKAAIKAGQALDPREIQELFDQLFATRLPFHDVHGRPTTVRLSRGELERKFGR
ncbi:MAG: DNA mismatch repair endonuclease MutL [Gemmatimonadales bacterium]|nr:MAG: DNA mismatch repair endonuclease MutL [Gemmatimonadales bacterium]